MNLGTLSENSRLPGSVEGIAARGAKREIPSPQFHSQWRPIIASTSYGVNNPLAVKLWARKLFEEALKATWFAKFIGTTSSSLIQSKSETTKSAGDRITVGLRMQLTGTGVQGDATLEGQEEALTTYNDNLYIDQLRHAVRSAGKMSEQRIPFEIREEAKNGLSDWWKDRLDSWFDFVGPLAA